MFNKEDKGKVIVCYPVVIGNGNKYIATNIANYYKQKYPNKGVALVDFDFKNPYLAGKLAIQDDIHGIDNIIDKIDGNFLDQNLFLENMIKLRNNVELLKGTKLIGNHRIITKNHIEKTLEVLKEAYDFIVVAVSCDIDNSGTVYGLFNADEVVMVCKNNFTNFKSMDRAINIIMNYKRTNSKLKLIFNMSQEGSDLDFTKHINDNEIEVIGAIKYDESTVDNEDLQGVSLASKVFKSKNKGQEAYESIIQALE